MLRFLLLTTFAAIVLAQVPPQSKYQGNVLTSRVVGGDVAVPNSWPWQVSLQQLSGGVFIPLCGGILIRRGWVLTSAQCVDSPRILRIAIGDHNINCNEGKEQFLAVSRVFIHPGWTQNLAAGNDIALLRLSTDAVLNNDVKLALLPPSGQILPNNNPCSVTGWGLTQSGGLGSALLRQASLPLVDYNTCSRPDWWGSTVKTTMICAGGASNSGCQGDSGGPLNCLVGNQWVVHGVTSFVSSLGCNTFRKPTVFTRVSNYIGWMNTILV